MEEEEEEGEEEEEYMEGEEEELEEEEEEEEGEEEYMEEGEEEEAYVDLEEEEGEEEFVEGEEGEEGEEEFMEGDYEEEEEDYPLDDDAIYFLLQVVRPATGEGIGLMLDGCDDGLEVQGILPGSAAALAYAPTGEQIEEGDIIYEVNGQQEDLGVAMREQVLKLSVMRFLSMDDFDDVEEGGVLEGDELVDFTPTPEDLELEPIEEQSATASKPAETDQEDFSEAEQAVALAAAGAAGAAAVAATRELKPAEDLVEADDAALEAVAFDEPYLRIVVNL